MLHHTFIFDQSCTLKVFKEQKGNLLGDGKMGGMSGKKEGWKSLCVGERMLRCNQEKIQALKMLALKH